MAPCTQELLDVCSPFESEGGAAAPKLNEEVAALPKAGTAAVVVVVPEVEAASLEKRLDVAGEEAASADGLKEKMGAG